jgi:preprotein translocase subunit YajC
MELQLTEFLMNVCLFAQGAEAEGQAAAQPGILQSLGPMLPMFAIMLFLYFFVVQAPQKRERLARENFLKNLKKNDRVITTGGIHGVVTNVRPEADRVTIRVDESTGTELRLSVSAIARLITEEDNEKK